MLNLLPEHGPAGPKDVDQNKCFAPTVLPFGQHSFFNKLQTERSALVNKQHKGQSKLKVKFLKINCITNT
jgi:hypothetical protein